MSRAKRISKISKIKISGLSVSIGGSQILSGVSFETEPGSLTFIIGRNGAGKSTLFKCVTGVLKNYGGAIDINGVPVSSLSARDRAKLVAYVPQSSPGDVPYTVADFLEMSRYPWRSLSSEADDRRAVADAMNMTGVEALSGRRLSSLSGGERQKVMIASAIAQESGIILMDEPTTYLDYAHQVETMEVMARVNRERGVTLIVVTHDVNLAIGMASPKEKESQKGEMAGVKVVALAGGRLTWTGPPSGLLEPGRLDEIYGVRFRQFTSGNPCEYPVLVPEMGARI
ncbi:MAG: ABC transporter ATP-binding protein [Synergistaceae bacterium]|jgi:iron complex transport system ATP-binding protein|nr:ABC transporter ATP-binding protein [Synergistaceae bacterium]